MDRNEIKTTFLLHQLKESSDIYKYLEDHNEIFIKEAFVDFLNVLLIKYDLKKSKLVFDSGLSKSYAYEIFSANRTPPRDTCLRLVIVMKISVLEAQHLLSLAKHSKLSPKNQRDAAIIFSLEKKFDLAEVNDLLYDLGLATFD